MKTSIFKLKRLLCLTIMASAFVAARAESSAEAVKTIVITANDSLRFSVTKIEAQPGEKIHVQLHNAGTMPKDVMGHNWILLKAGADPVAYANAAVSAKTDGYQPKALADQVLAAIPLLGPKQTGDVTFSAPTAPGTYSFLCSFPAHVSAGMRGTLIVK